ncbi:MAG: sucrose-6-phosphate hydrolase [Sporolactobacillus sp.]
MEWTREMRYRPLEQWSEAEKSTLINQVNASPWRLGYHIQPKTGLLNDPNGFCFFNTCWHLFYQHYPMGPVHGLKCWHHLVSKDLVHWTDEGEALKPDSALDSHGCYSGSALSFDDRLFIMYTGNVRTRDWQRRAYQLGAWMDTENHIEKINRPLISSLTERCTEHFRDPQIIRHGKDYLALIGAQTPEQQGRIYLYRSTDLNEWTFVGPLALGKDSLGYMIECPNLVFIDNRPVLIFCPQGLSHKQLDYQNIYPNTYLVGDDFDAARPAWIGNETLANIDEGFDFYAAQAIHAPDGRALLVGWIGLPDIAYPTDAYGWAHCLSLVRELTLKDGHLYQNPARETTKLRQELRSGKGTLRSSRATLIAQAGRQYELDIHMAGKQSVHLLLASDGKRSLDVNIDFQLGTLTLERSHAGTPFAENYGTQRTISLKAGAPVDLQIFIDESVAEIYINGGCAVMTARFFPSKDQTDIEMVAAGDLSYTYEYWNLSL